MLRTMAEPLGEVCSVTRRLLRRGLELQTSRCVNVFFPAKGRILFEQASYVKLPYIRHFFSQNVMQAKSNDKAVTFSAITSSIHNRTPYMYF
jgi:hypothetical protein